MDEGKILLVNFGKGRLGEDSSSLLGGLLVTTIGLAAYSRADIAESKRKTFFAYVEVLVADTADPLPVTGHMVSASSPVPGQAML